MFCAQCHSPNAVDNKFCSECGIRIDGSLAAWGSPEIVQLLSRALTLLDQRDWAQAHAAVDAALALDPENASAHSVRSILFEREGKVPEAIRELEWVVARNPQSSTDLAKLNALRGHATSSPSSRRRWTPQQITFATAAVAGLIVFGGGLAILNQASTPQRTAGNSQTAGLQPASATLPPSSTNTAPTAPKPLRTLPTAPAGMAGTVVGPPAPAPPRAAVGNPATPVFTAPGRQALLRPSAPLSPLGMPQVGATGAKPGTGLPPAAIGEVVPLPQTPAIAPGGPALASATVPPLAGPGGAPGVGAPVPAPTPAAETPKPESTDQKPRVEPLEPETGFIKIEPLKGAGEGRGAAPGAAKAAPPSISVNIASSGGDEAAIAEAQRAQRNAFSAARLANLEDAERHYRQAAGLYELLVKRGGSSARQAREGLDACRKALAALRSM